MTVPPWTTLTSAMGSVRMSPQPTQPPRDINIAMGDNEDGRCALKGLSIILLTTLAAQHRRPTTTRCGRVIDAEVPSVTKTLTTSTSMGRGQEVPDHEMSKQVC